jgi:hypothetical protein
VLHENLNGVRLRTPFCPGTLPTAVGTTMTLLSHLQRSAV